MTFDMYKYRTQLDYMDSSINSKSDGMHYIKQMIALIAYDYIWFVLIRKIKSQVWCIHALLAS